jgi:pentatricopeptide repeat protein
MKLLPGLKDGDEGLEALLTFETASPSPIGIGHLLKMYAVLKQEDQVKKYEHMLLTKWSGSISMQNLNVLLRMYAMLGRADDFDRIFAKFIELGFTPNIYTFNAKVLSLSFFQLKC